MIRALVADDSPVARELLVYILESDPEISVIGTVDNGEKVLEFVKYNKPDIITMDINMPEMDGLVATRRIMETTPVPIIIVTASYDPKEVETTFRAVEAGALIVKRKPVGISHPDHEAEAKDLVQTVKLMSEVKVVRRRAGLSRAEERPKPRPEVELTSQHFPKIELVAVGASTGGPIAIHDILSRLPKDFSTPLLIVQHITAGFLDGFLRWLSQGTPLTIHIADHGERLLAGHVYFAPDDMHMGVAGGDRIELSRGEPENGLRPSVSYLFRSIANVLGNRAVGVLLTGMGKDGAAELRMMKDKGAITIAQDKESAVVYGMPGEAAKLAAASYVLPSDRIAKQLNYFVNRNRSRRSG